MHQSHKSSKIKIRGLGSIEMNFENEIFFYQKSSMYNINTRGIKEI